MNPVGCEIGTQKSFFVLEHRGGVDKANRRQRRAEFPQPTVQGFGISIDGFGRNRKFPIGLAGGLCNRVNRLHNDACGGGNALNAFNQRSVVVQVAVLVLNESRNAVETEGKHEILRPAAFGRFGDGYEIAGCSVLNGTGKRCGIQLHGSAGVRPYLIGAQTAARAQMGGGGFPEEYHPVEIFGSEIPGGCQLSAAFPQVGRHGCGAKQAGHGQSNTGYGKFEWFHGRHVLLCAGFTPL